MHVLKISDLPQEAMGTATPLAYAVRGNYQAAEIDRTPFLCHTPCHENYH